jgi:hypothetical protein
MASPSRISAYHPLYPPINLHVTIPPRHLLSLPSPVNTHSPVSSLQSSHITSSFPYSGTMHPLPFTQPCYLLLGLCTQYPPYSLLIRLCHYSSWDYAPSDFMQALLFYWDYAPFFLIMQPCYCLFGTMHPPYRYVLMRSCSPHLTEDIIQDYTILPLIICVPSLSLILRHYHRRQSPGHVV